MSGPGPSPRRTSVKPDPSSLYSSSALPLPVLVGLFYRVAVMYAASRIILALKRQNEGYEDTRKLSEEEPVSISELQ